MQNNRMLQISTAGSRKATQWPQSTIMRSELVEKLKTPVWGTETLDQYLALPKSRQDDLKDVGGFVMGRLKEGKRKKENVLSRSALTLDMDYAAADIAEARPHNAGSG